MACTGIVLLLLALCGIANVHTTSSTTQLKTSVSPSTSTKSPKTTVTRTTSNTTAKPGNSTATPGISTATPGNSTAMPGNSTATPGNPSTTPGNPSTNPPITKPVPSSKPGNHSTTPKVTPTPKGHGDKKSDQGKWVATGFAVVFFLTTVIMTVLYCRQRRIYRELEGDSSLSRLI